MLTSFDALRVNPKWGITHLGGRDFATAHLTEGLGHIGGYRLEALDEIITTAYGMPVSWDLYSVPIPKKDEHMPFVRALLDMAQWANVRKEKIHFLFVYGTTTWADAFAKFGLNVLNEAKVTKRMAGLMARRALSMWTDTLNIHEVAWDAFATEEFGDDTEKLLDGAGIISRHLFENMVHTWEDAVSVNYRTFNIDQMSERFYRAIMVNARVFTHNGVLKGNFRIMDPELIEELYGSAFDIVVPADSFKAGVHMPEDRIFITAEVQEFHETVYTDVQTMINLRALFTDSFMTEIAKDFFAKLRVKVEEGKLLTSVADLINREVDILRDEDVDFDYSDLAIQWAAGEWVARDLDLRNSESLLRGVAEAKTRLAIRKDKLGNDVDFKLPVPCAYYMQVISLSAARMYGFKANVRNGEARVWWNAKMVVLTDRDFVDNYTNFGGSDLDDFYKVFFRTVEGQESLVICRSPNGYGEYAVFRHHQGDNAPEWRKADGTIERFPEVKGKLPKQLTKAIEDGTTHIVEVDNPVTHLYTGEPITREDVWVRINAERNRKANAGQMVNAAMLYAMVMKRHLPMSLGTMETFIDLTTQEDLHPKAAIMLQGFAAIMMAEAVNSGRPIDAKFWNDRNFGRSRVFKDLRNNGVIGEPNLVDQGPDALFSVRFKHIREIADTFLTFARNKANEAVPPVGVLELGELKLGSYGGTTGQPSSMMAGVLRDFRSSIAREFRAVREITPAGKPIRLSDATWVRLYNKLHSKVTTDGKGNVLPKPEQYANVLALAAASFKFRKGYLYCQVANCRKAALKSTVTVKGVEYQLCHEHKQSLTSKTVLETARFSDNAVTNRALFGLYVEALEYYGTATPLGTYGMHADAWDVECSVCGAEHTFTDPVQYLRFEAVNHSTCKGCRAEGRG
jgi:hypothetical protein